MSAQIIDAMTFAGEIQRVIFELMDEIPDMLKARLEQIYLRPTF